MSDQPDQNDIVAIANEYRRLQRQLEDKTAQLAALVAPNAENGEFPVDFAGALNKRYSIEFQFTPSEVETPLQVQEQSVTVDSGTIFRCAYVENFVRAIGTAVDPYSGDPVTVQATLPWNTRLSLFDFFWSVRDTGTDREWCDTPQPSLFFGGGYTGPLWLPRRNLLGGGSTIFVNIQPTLLSVGPGFFFTGGSIQQYILQMCFVGHEVPDDGAL